MIAPPSDMPELTKPNTLPICPAAAASLTITSRGVRLALIMEDAALPDDRQHDRKAQQPDKQQRAAPPQHQRQSRRRRWRGGKSDVPDKGVKGEGPPQFRPIHRPAEDRVIGRVDDRVADA